MMEYNTALTVLLPLKKAIDEDCYSNQFFVCESGSNRSGAGKNISNSIHTNTFTFNCCRNKIK